MATRKTDEPKTSEVREVSFTPEALEAVIDQAVAMALEANNTKHQALFDAALAGKIVQPKGGKTERSTANEIAVIRAFKKAGYGVVTPRINVKTFRRWVEEDGRRPVEGSKSLKVKNLRLFHISQTRLMEAEERDAIKEQQSAAAARHESGKVIPIGVSPQ